jgi:azurin
VDHVLEPIIPDQKIAMKIKEISLAIVFALTSAASLHAQAATTSIEISGNDSMKFNITSFTVKPGEVVHVSLSNVGTLPKTVMGHNWILLKAGKDGAAYSAAAANAKNEDYQPKALAGDVIASIGLLGARQNGEVTFTAPSAPGNYVYVCSFPGHFQVGMRGVMVVK